MAVLTLAGQAEILRAAQKDELYVQQLEGVLADIGSRLLGNRLWIKLRNVSRVAASMAYYAVTTLSTLQTIGEEYTGIVQVDRTGRKLPSWKVRFRMVLLDCASLYLILYVLKHFEQELKSIKSGASLRSQARHILLNTVQLLLILIPTIQTLHKGIFYFTGKFFSVSKRLTSIRYILVRHWYKDAHTRMTFCMLGLITMVYGCAAGAERIARWWRETACEPPVTMPGEERAPWSCPLCLDNVKDMCCSQCGHMFCWDCIMEWLQSKPVCPLCRENLHPSRVIPLTNYLMSS